VQTDDRDPPMGVDYEGELAVILGRDARDVPMDQAQEVIAAVACANGVSQRWWQWHSSGGQWCRGKSFDTFCPLGEVVPQASTATMIFPVARLISELSQGTTLLAGVVPWPQAAPFPAGCVAWVQSNPKRSKISRSLRDSASRGFTLSSID
jgi:2-keto-4-pentenoate hydratase/2-oxohepta-3-ene-1,7-dioic acid hydratase in catechol pathway